MLDDIFWMVSIEVGNNVCWGCLVVFLMSVSMCCFAAWVFPKIMVPPNHPLKNKVFHEINHPFLGFSPYFWFNTHVLLCCMFPGLGGVLGVGFCSLVDG